MNTTLTSILAIAIILSPIRGPETGAQGNQKIVNPKALELASLSKQRDTIHTIEVNDKDGAVWFRDPASIIDLRQIKYKQAWIMDAEVKGQFMIGCLTRNDGADSLRRWTSAHREEELGVFIDGQLCSHAPMHTIISSFFAITPFDTLDEAMKACALIRTGGDESRVDEEIGRLKARHAKAEEEERKRAKRPPEEVPPTESFEFVSVRMRPDAMHETRAGRFRGVDWYRETTPGLDASQCTFIRHYGRTPGEDRVQRIVRDEHVASLAAWCKANADKTFGFIQDGKLVLVGILPEKLSDESGPLALLAQAKGKKAETTSAPSSVGDDTPRVEVSVERSYVDANVVTRGAFEVAAIRQTANAEFNVPLRDANGKAWFGSASDKIVLEKSTPVDAVIVGTLDGSYRLCVNVKSSVQPALAEFCKKHAGERIGIMLEHFPLMVRTLDAHAPNVIEIESYSNWLAASRARDLLRDELPKLQQSLSAKQARAMIIQWCDDHKQATRPDLSSDDITDVTQFVPTLMQRLGVQLFTFGLQGYLIQGDKVFPLGESFGGMGLLQACVSDLDGDGHPELLFAYSWGSGIHRSEIGAWCDAWPAPGVVKMPYAYRGTPDYRLDVLSDRNVRVLAGKVVVGRLTLHISGGKPKLGVKLNEDIPKEVRDDLWDYSKELSPNSH